MEDLRQLITDDSVWDDLERIEKLLLEAASSEDDYLTTIAHHLLLARGEPFRPLLAVLSSRVGPARDDRGLRAAVAVGLSHGAGLYRDDVIDEADPRRGAPAVNADWSNTVAILAGDVLMAPAS